jgi:alpha-beta hydrolase superfamily lysophospholipase
MQYWKIFIMLGGIIMLILGLMSGCGSTESEPMHTVSEEVNWKIDETTVYGTITKPNNDSVYPAILFIAGSGPTDRDWNSPLMPGANGSGRLLAEALASKGLITLRYDKRFSGTHAQDNLPYLIGKISMQSHLDEVRGAVNLLLNRKDVDPNHIFVLTSSEGAVHVLNYQRQAEKSRFSGLVLTGPPGRSIAELTKTQMEALFSTLPDSAQLMLLYEKDVSDFEAGRAVEPDPELPDGAKQLLLSLSSPANQPFSRELWDTDISPWLRDTTEPVLVLIGKKDIQVDYQLDGGRLEDAAKGKTNINFVYPENANHVLKYEENPRSQLGPNDVLNYNADERILDQDALKAIVDWLVSR